MVRPQVLVDEVVCHADLHRSSRNGLLLFQTRFRKKREVAIGGESSDEFEVTCRLGDEGDKVGHGPIDLAGLQGRLAILSVREEHKLYIDPGLLEISLLKRYIEGGGIDGAHHAHCQGGNGNVRH